MAVYKVKITGDPHSSYGYVTINGTAYGDAIEKIYTETPEISVYVSSSRGILRSKCKVILNGTTVQSGYGTYNLALGDADTVTINIVETYDGAAYYSAEITTEKSSSGGGSGGSSDDGHRANLDGIAYEIAGGTGRMSGVGYEIESGMTRVDGVAYEIAFTPEIYTVTLTGYPYSTWCCIAIDGVKYTQPTTLEVVGGTVITCYAKGYSGKGCRITVNGVNVKTGTTTQISYDYTVKSNVTIDCSHGSGIVSYTDIVEL